MYSGYSVGSATVEILEMSWIPAASILERFPNLQFWNIWDCEEPMDERTKWDDLPDNPFTSVVPIR